MWISEIGRFHVFKILKRSVSWEFSLPVNALPADPFPSSELPEVHKIRQFPDLGALKLWKGQSGSSDFILYIALASEECTYYISYLILYYYLLYYIKIECPRPNITDTIPSPKNVNSNIFVCSRMIWRVYYIFVYKFSIFLSMNLAFLCGFFIWYSIFLLLWRTGGVDKLKALPKFLVSVQKVLGSS